MAQQLAREEALTEKIDSLMNDGYSLEWLDTQAALHNPDQIAGGNPLNIGGMGDKGINSSIGAQWKYRIDDVDDQIRKMAENMTQSEKENTYLNVKLQY
jgi:2-keto-3-deoxy-L-rhamnonate aldolase RhmA